MYHVEVALLHSENSPHTIVIWLSWGFQGCPNFQVTHGPRNQGLGAYKCGVGIWVNVFA